MLTSIVLQRPNQLLPRSLKFPVCCKRKSAKLGVSFNPLNQTPSILLPSNAPFSVVVSDGAGTEPEATFRFGRPFCRTWLGWCKGFRSVVFKLALNDKDRVKAMKMAASFSGVDSVSFDGKDQNMTVIGQVDPVRIVSKLRKLGPVEILAVGPPRELAKEEPKQHEEKYWKVDYMGKNINVIDSKVASTTDGSTGNPNPCCVT